MLFCKSNDLHNVQKRGSINKRLHLFEKMEKGTFLSVCSSGDKTEKSAFCINFALTEKG